MICNARARAGRDFVQKETKVMDDLKRLIRDVPNFPKPGIIFKDITPLLANPAGLALAVELLANPFRGQHVDVVAGAESRGFIFGIAVAQALSCGFVPIRKPRKLPAEKISLTYELEYGHDTLEMHRDAIAAGQQVLIVDDLLATGGTMKACCELVEEAGGHVLGIAVLIELMFIKAGARFTDYNLHSVIRYESP